MNLTISFCVYQLKLKWSPLNTWHLYIFTHDSSTQNGKGSSRFPAMKILEVVMDIQCLKCRDSGHVNFKPRLQHNK